MVVRTESEEHIMIRRYLMLRSCSAAAVSGRGGRLRVPGAVRGRRARWASSASSAARTPAESLVGQSHDSGCPTAAFFVWAAEDSNGADLDSVLVRPVDPDDDHVAWAHVRGARLAHRDDPAGWRRPDRGRPRGGRRAVVQRRAVRSRHRDVRPSGDARCSYHGRAIPQRC